MLAFDGGIEYNAGDEEDEDDEDGIWLFDDGAPVAPVPVPVPVPVPTPQYIMISPGSS